MRLHATLAVGLALWPTLLSAAAPMPFPFDVVAGPNGTVWSLADTAGTFAPFGGGFCGGDPGVGVTDAHTTRAIDAFDVGMMRVLDSFQNPTAATINVVVEMPVNFGSDNTTTIGATSSGDLVFTTADRWLITSDGPVPSDPVNTTVLAGPGAPALTPVSVTQTVFDCSFPNGAGWTFNLSVPAGATRRLMAYAGLEDMVGTGNTVAGAIANAAIFNDAMLLHTTTDLTSGLTAPQLLEIVNWDFSFVPVELQTFGIE